MGRGYTDFFSFHFLHAGLNFFFLRPPEDNYYFNGDDVQTSKFFFVHLFSITKLYLTNFLEDIFLFFFLFIFLQSCRQGEHQSFNRLIESDVSSIPFKRNQSQGGATCTQHIAA